MPRAKRSRAAPVAPKTPADTDATASLLDEIESGHGMLLRNWVARLLGREPKGGPEVRPEEMNGPVAGAESRAGPFGT